MFGTFMEVLDTTVVNVSLPHIAGTLSATVEEATWVLTSYLVANAIILPITGWLANRFGRKRLLLAAVVSFTGASFLCGLAPTLPMLILFRLIQGASGGTLQPLSQAVLLESFAPQDRGKAMGFWGLGIVVAPILGPVLGGWITDSYSWRWIFYINIPVGILSLIMVSRYVFDPPYLQAQKRSIDGWGIGMLAIWVAALQIMLDKGQQEDWFASHFIVGLTLVFVGFFIAFLVREFLAGDPVVKLSIFRDRTYSAGVVLITIVGVVLYGSLVLLPLWLQTLLGYPSYQAGLALAPRGVGSLIGMPLVGALVGKLDPRRLLMGGVLLGAFTLFQFSDLNLNAGYWDFFWPQFLQGLALALLFVPLTTISMNSIPKERMGDATSLFNLMRNLGGSIGIAAVVAIQSGYVQAHINSLGAHVTPYDRSAAQMLQQLDRVNPHKRSLAMMFGMVQQQASILSFIDVFRIMAAVFLLMFPLIFLMKKPPKGVKVEAAH